MGGEERVARQHASGRLTVRERIERLLRPRQLPRDRRARGQGRLRRRRRDRGLPARQRRDRLGADRRPPRDRPGRRLHRPRRRRRRRHLAEDGLRRADGARPAAAARAPRRRHGRRRQRQDARDDGLLVRAAAARLRGRRWRTSAIVPVVAAALGPVAGLGAARVVCSHFSVIVKGTRAAVRGRPAGGGRGHGRGAGQGGARRRPDAGARGRCGQRGRGRGRRARPAQALPLLPAGRTSGRRRRRPPPQDPRRPARAGAALDRPARPPPPLQDAAHPGGRARPRLAVRARSPLRPAADHRAWPASAAGRWACWPPTPSTTAAG